MGGSAEAIGAVGDDERVPSAPAERERGFLRRSLLMSGVLGAALYPLADVVAARRYPGFSYRDQAVSELFALGAPTAGLVVPLFSVSSTLLLLFAFGIWKSANDRRSLRWLAVMMALNALDALVLWNAFPMHMRGSQPTFTDLMHGLLAIDPFLLAAVVLGAVAFRGAFRTYPLATLAFSSVLAVLGFSYVDAVVANEPTPWMGAAERAAQYATNLWYAVLAAVLLREGTAARPSSGASSGTSNGASSGTSAGASSGTSSGTPPGAAPTSAKRGSHRFALACGLLSALLYATMLVVVPLAWSGYSSASQTVSELSAIDAPTRPLWVPLGRVWTLLYAVFGWGVWQAGGSSRALRLAGAAIVVSAVVGIAWPPMHLREVLAAGGGTRTDTLHVVWTAVNAAFTLAAMGFAAAALGRGFRAYTLASMAVLIASGALTSRSAPRLEAGLATPWMGVWERVDIAAWLLWVAVLSALLLRGTVRRPSGAGPRSPSSGTPDQPPVSQSPARNATSASRSAGGIARCACLAR